MAGCQQLPSNHGSVVTGLNFKHRIVKGAYFHSPNKSANTLRIYIEGDGRPWTSRFQKAQDPSSKTPSLYPIMMADTQAALYLGRPCYFVTSDNACSPIWWTEKRYHQAIVNSMLIALQKNSTQFSRIIFIGHSGGATLAALLAPLEPRTAALITIAGNLDITHWAQYHAYSPLEGSINPIKQAPLAKQICQLHVIAANDAVIQASWIKNYMQLQTESQPFSLLLKKSSHNSYGTYWADIEKAITQCTPLKTDAPT